MDAEISNIKFPRKLKLAELEELLMFVGKNIPAEIDYTITLTYRTGVRRFGLEERKDRELTSVGNLTGIIYPENNDKGWIGFKVESSLNREENYEFNFSDLEFDTIPGYTTEELQRTFTANPDLIKIIGEHTQKYFKNSTLKMKGGE